MHDFRWQEQVTICTCLGVPVFSSNGVQLLPAIHCNTQNSPLDKFQSDEKNAKSTTVCRSMDYGLIMICSQLLTNRK